MEITPALHLKNEEYWIHYVLRDLLKVFDKVIMLDTGSTDQTVEIAKATASAVGGRLELVVEDMHNDLHRIGNCPNVLREMVDTDWMLLVDGDEIWGENQLRALVSFEPQDNWLVGMCNGRNLAWVGNQLVEREGFSADRLFYRTVRWDKRKDYPFQAHGLELKFEAGQVFHTNFEQSYFWHARHLQRSSRDTEACYRVIKRDYFPHTGGCVRELPENWLGEIADWPNPYV